MNGVSTTVYTIVYNPEGVWLTINASYVASGHTVTLTATVKDENGDPVSGATVSFYKETT